MKFVLDGKVISRKALGEIVGQERLARMIAEAKEAHRDDPWEEVSWWIGRGMLVVEFDC